MKNQLLLVEDVEGFGRSGDVVSVKPGFARNYLIPQKKAVVADPFTLRMQQKLKEERSKKAIVDKKEAEELAKQLENVALTVGVKVDPEGHMYGSVSAGDIANFLQKEGFTFERKNVVLPHPIKVLGDFDIALRLKEGVSAKIKLKIVAEGKGQEASLSS